MLMGISGVAGQSGSTCKELQGSFIHGARRSENSGSKWRIGRAWHGLDGNKGFYGIIPNGFRLGILAIHLWHIVQYRGVLLRAKCEYINHTFDDARNHNESFILLPISTTSVAARDM